MILRKQQTHWTGAAAASSTDVEPLTQGLAQASAQTKNAGWSIQETTAVLGKFADAES